MILSEIKNYLRIDYDEDDEILKNLIEVSETYIESCVGTSYKTDEKAKKLSDLLQKKIIADMFENRGTEIANSTKKDIMVTTILDKLSNYSEDE